MIRGCEVKGFAADTAAATTPIRVHSCGFVVKVLREAENEATLRAFRNANRFTTFKIFRFFWKFVLARSESGEL